MIPIAFADGPDRLVRQSVQWDWGQLTQRLAQSDIGIKDGTGWLPVEIDPGPRNAERVKSVSLLVLDVEAKSEKIKRSESHRGAGTAHTRGDAGRT